MTAAEAAAEAAVVLVPPAAAAEADAVLPVPENGVVGLLPPVFEAANGKRVCVCGH